MNLANKTFRKNSTGELIRVLDCFEDIAILENKEKVSVSDLNNPSIYTEQIDPNSFFNNQSAYNDLANKIKSIDTNKIQDDPNEIANKIGSDDNFSPATNESAIIVGSPEDEAAELARKYNINPEEAVQKQSQAFSKILGEDGEATKSTPERNTSVQVNGNNQPIQNKTYHQPPQQEDPIITMFKRTKRGVDFNTDISISGKIPRIDFIEMMEDSYEISIIDFLSEEFTSELLNNPYLLKEKIKKEIQLLVYGEEWVEEQEKIKKDKEEAEAKEAKAKEAREAKEAKAREAEVQQKEQEKIKDVSKDRKKKNTNSERTENENVKDDENEKDIKKPKKSIKQGTGLTGGEGSKPVTIKNDDESPKEKKEDVNDK